MYAKNDNITNHRPSMITNENNYTSNRNKLLNDFTKDEQQEKQKYIEETESLILKTKSFIKDLMGGQVKFDSLIKQLDLIETEFGNNYNKINKEVSLLQLRQNSLKKRILNLQIDDIKNNNMFKEKINTLQTDLKSKERTIQNMERIYIELEDIIQNNIDDGNEDLLTMEQFTDFVSQNQKLKDEIKVIENEKINIEGKYNKILKENMILRKNDERFENEFLKKLMNEIENREKNKNVRDNLLKDIKESSDKHKILYENCEKMENKILKLINNLKGINIDNYFFNLHLFNIQQEIMDNMFPKTEKSRSIPNKKRGNKFLRNNSNEIDDEYNIINEKIKKMFKKNNN